MSKGRPSHVGDIKVQEVERVLERVEQGQIEPEDYAVLKQWLAIFVQVIRLLQSGRAKISKLRRMLGWTSSEKTRDVLGRATSGAGSASGNGPEEDGPEDGSGGGAAPPYGGSSGDSWDSSPANDSAQSNAGTTTGPKGHGRLSADEYDAAEQISVDHESLRPGDRGWLYDLKRPERIVRIMGQPPLCAKCWNLQRLRCSACGEVYTARAPAEAQGGKYSETAVSMLALLRFGMGVPHYRLERLEENLQTPIPASTQWQVLHEAAEVFRPLHQELIWQAAQAPVLHSDDTYGRVLSEMGKRRDKRLARGELEDPERTGLFTTAIVAVAGVVKGLGRGIVLFFTGRKHCGENLGGLLEKRDGSLEPPISMSDALSRNKPGGHEVRSSYCMAHARRYFVDQYENFPEPCAWVLGEMGKVFTIDDEYRARPDATEEGRLREHQKKSAPVMEKLQTWMTAQFDQHLVEPNSGLGKAITYCLKRWDELTRFLRTAGVPLDNNLCERALKMSIRHRKNSLFFRTPEGAKTGDMYMSLIHTAELCGQNVFAYLTALQLHGRAVAAEPCRWMPWNWTEALPQAADRQPNGEAA